ncbi:MAG: hypothetical protein J5850_03965 [Clostridia bacterium]|nr:hypothetical protein [Clostridia bacterium]
MAELLEYKCPNCGGALEFSSALQKMLCPFCDSTFEMEGLLKYDEVLKSAVEDKMEWNKVPTEQMLDLESDGLAVYICTSCGGEVVGDMVMAASSCPYCGNPVVVMKQFTGVLKPDMVIPFKLDKESAKKGLRAHYEGKRLLPDVFKDENHIDEIKGIYVPFWLFDAEADANVKYLATRTRAWQDSKYIYTETSHFSVLRAGSLGFEAVPVDGSSKISNDMMESIEPYDLSQAVDFQTAYLAGYLADKYDVDSEESISRANERIRNSTEQAFASTVTGFGTVTKESSTVNLSETEVKYALFPVWFLNTSWNGETYTFAMNGQTGKFVGNLPCDKKKYRKWLWGLTAILGLALTVLIHLISRL